MMSKQSMNGRNQFTMLTMDELVPQDHLVRKIDAAIDFSFIYPIVESTYSTLGRPSIDPIILIKLVFIQYLFGIRSMRQTIKEVETNMAYRWFLGLGFTDSVPHFSTFGKNYVRRFAQTTLFEEIFSYILEQAVKAGFVTDETIYMDSTHIKANANKHRFTKEMTYIEAKAFQDELEDEINVQRQKEGKRPFIWGMGSELTDQGLTERKISKADPESGYYVKGEREKQFAYSAHTACDEHGFVLDVVVTPGNIHDSQAAVQLVKKVKREFPEMKLVVADAAYKTPMLTRFFSQIHVRPVLPYTRPKGKKEFLPLKLYVYDEYYDCYLCPGNQELTFSTVNRKGYREYKSNPKKCILCPLLNECTQSENHQKVINRHVWAAYVEEAEHLRHTELNRKLYPRRKETVERVFADAKEKHGMRWTKYHGLEKVARHTMLTFAAMNLKKLATWLWRKAGAFYFFVHIFSEVTQIGIRKLLIPICLQSEESEFLIPFLYYCCSTGFFINP
ncbi:IS1182 family transposase [Candidatus Enterococcus ferrettii]|uniref:Transposase n=2 Tax=Candidatus Enterococcus ferrettii TaxID=2815324 RepID=A0ABV0EQG7_9ENTE